MAIVLAQCPLTLLIAFTILIKPHLFVPRHTRRNDDRISTLFSEKARLSPFF